MRESVRRAVDACYAAVGDPDGWREAINLLCGALGGQGAVFIPLQVRKIDFPLIPSEAIRESSESYVRDGWTEHDFRIPRMLPQLHRGVLLEDDITSAEEMRSTAYFQDFMAPFRLKWWAGVFAEGGGERWCLSLLRTDNQDRFQEEDRRELLQLKPHFGRMLDTAKVVEALRTEASVESLGKSGASVALLDRQARIVGSTAKFARAMGRSLEVRFGKLHAPNDTVDRRLQDRIQLVLRQLFMAQPEQAMLVPKVDGPGDVLVRIMPLAARPLPIMNTARAMVILTDLSATVADLAGRLALWFSLTPHEARIAARAGAGIPPALLVDELGLTLGTIRSALHHVYLKLGIRGQADLARIVSRIAVGLAE